MSDSTPTTTDSVDLSDSDGEYLFDISEFKTEDLGRKKARERCEVCIIRECADPLPALPGATVCRRHVKQLLRKKIRDDEDERSAVMEVQESTERIYSYVNRKKAADTERAKELNEKSNKRAQVQAKIDSELRTEMGKLKKFSPTKKAKPSPKPSVPPVPAVPQSVAPLVNPLYPTLPGFPPYPYPSQSTSSSSTSATTTTTESPMSISAVTTTTESPINDFSELNIDDPEVPLEFRKIKDATVSEFSAEVKKKADELVPSAQIAATNSLFQIISQWMTPKSDSNVENKTAP